LLRYKGIRPAQVIRLVRPFRKPTIWKLLNVERRNKTLTESMAMYHRFLDIWKSKSKYFGLGKIKEDQVIDYINEEVSLMMSSDNG
jgi:5-methyltetrahydrofolate--homocysteine methyltransferase